MQKNNIAYIFFLIAQSIAQSRAFLPPSGEIEGAFRRG
jgi:hypothetical protein